MAIPVLALRDVTLLDGRQAMVEHVDLALEPGARACLVGRNGAGKSTLLKLLAGVIEPDFGERTATAGLRMALAAQEPLVEAPSLVDYVMRSGVLRHAAEEALETFGLDPVAPGHGLSGGEARRASLAAALACDPDVLLLDEPTNHLDIPAIQTLEKVIARSRAAILVVSHDRAFLSGLTTSCFSLENRRLRRLNAGFADFDAWAKRIEAGSEAESRRREVALARDERWLARGVTARRARNEGRRRRLVVLRAEKAQRLRQAAAGLRAPPLEGERSGRLVLEARGVSKAFNGRTLLIGFSTRILRGERVAIVGANGSGKTTLVKMLQGEVAPDEGSIRLGSNLQVAYIDQQRAPLTPGMTVLEALAPAGGDQIMVQGRPRHVSSYARDFLFRDGQLRQGVESLSGGERNRLLLARTLAQPSNLLVLDEPTNDLDLETLDVLEDVLDGYSGTLILVSHDRDFIDRVATSTIALDGRSGFVETPGGWADFVAQNPGFLNAGRAKPRPTGPAPSRPRFVAPERFGYREVKRLAELEEEVHALAAEIAAAERRLSDAGLFLRDAAEFRDQSAILEQAKAALSRVEQEWLDLEERRDRLSEGQR